MAKIGKVHFQCKAAQGGGVQLDLFCCSNGVFSIKLPPYLIKVNGGKCEVEGPTKALVVNAVHGLCKLADETGVTRPVIAYKYITSCEFESIPCVALHVAFYDEIEFTTEAGPVWDYERQRTPWDVFPDNIVNTGTRRQMDVIYHCHRVKVRPDNIIPDTPVNRDFLRRAGTFLQRCRDICDPIFTKGSTGLLEAVLNNQPLTLNESRKDT